MSKESEGQDILKRPLTRRQLLGGSVAAVAGLGTAAILGCGDEEEGTSKPPGGTYADPGISDTEVKIGNILPITGPILPNNALPNSLKAYIAYINAEKGGVDGRKINLIQLDGQYNPPASLELTRRLVEQDQVFAMFAVLGTPINLAIMPYLESKKVPNLMIYTGASVFLDPAKVPLAPMNTTAYLVEGGVLGKQIVEDLPNAKVAVLRQNDSLGTSYLEGLKKGMGAKASQVVSEQTYEVTDTTMAPQVLNMKNSGADVLFLATILRVSILGVKEAFAQNWKPLVVGGITSQLTDTVNTVGKEQMKGSLAAFVSKDPRDPAYENDKAIVEGKRIINQYQPGTELSDPIWPGGLSAGATLVEILKKMKTPTRAGLMESARSLEGFDGGGLMVPGVTWNGLTTTNATVTKMRLARWDGTKWVQFGGVVDGAEYLK